MRVLLTGGSGFIGNSILTFLEETDNEILSFSRYPHQPKKNAQTTWSQVDLTKPLNYKAIINEFKPEALIHLAWQDIPDFSLNKCQQNLIQSLNLIDCVLTTDSCRKILVSGSCFELNIKKGEAYENIIGTPKDNFTWAKHALRSWLELECNKRSVFWGWFRIFYAYGPGQRVASLLPTILKHFSNNTIPPINTPANQNDFIYVDDIAQAFINALSFNGESGIFHLGTGKATAILEMCRIAEWCVNRSDSLTQELIAKTSETNIDISFWANTSQTQNKLHWNPKIILEEGIERTWQSLSKK